VPNRAGTWSRHSSRWAALPLRREPAVSVDAKSFDCSGNGEESEGRDTPRRRLASLHESARLSAERTLASLLIAMEGLTACQVGKVVDRLASGEVSRYCSYDPDADLATITMKVSNES
jgi:hypothetical protein